MRIYKMEKKEIVIWKIDDFCDDDYRKHDSFNILVKYNGEEDVIKKLEDAENIIQEKFDIDLSKWFKEYWNYNIPSKDVKKLDELGIEYNKRNLTIDKKLAVLCTKDYFLIWKQLMEKADNDLKINKIEQKCFYSKCTGHGLFE